MVVGGGKKHLSRYDLNKATSQRYRYMDKKYISALDLAGSLAITGQFAGELDLFDISSGKIVSSFKVNQFLYSRIWT